MKKLGIFSTYDLALASSLVVSGFAVTKIDRSYHNKRVSFVFTNTPQLGKVVNQYWSNDLMVSPKLYFDAIKHLKTRIYERN